MVRLRLARTVMLDHAETPYAHSDSALQPVGENATGAVFEPRPVRSQELAEPATVSA